MIFKCSLTAGVAEIAIPDPESIPSYVANDPWVAKYDCRIFSAFLAPPSQQTVHQAYLIVPSAFVPEDVEARLSQPAQVIGRSTLHVNSGRLEWKIHVETIEFEACRHALAGPEDVGGFEVYLHAVPETLAFRSNDVAGTWVVYLSEDPQIQFWSVPPLLELDL